MTVLYRKYRPQTFASIVGQEHVKTTLSQEVISGRLAHSYLFTGPRGIGKTSTARIFAKALNCTKRAKGSPEPCGECDSCQEITTNRSLDVIEIDAASHTGVDNVREQIIENARFAPVKSIYKIFIIDEVHMLSTSAFNALLKILEEPPTHVLFILATTELHKLPATVVSRCQRFDFRKIERTELINRLALLAEEEGITVEPEVLAGVARHSEGCLRDAESLLSQLFSLGEKKITVKNAALVMPMLSSEAVYELAVGLLEKDSAATLKRWTSLAESGGDLIRTIGDLTDLFRAMAMSRLKKQPFEAPFATDPVWRERLDAARLTFDSTAAATLIQRLVVIRDEMKRSDLPELPFELMVMEWSEELPRVKKNSEPPRSAPRATEEQPVVKSAQPPVQEKVETAIPMVAEVESVELNDVKRAWPDVLRKAQEKYPSLSYILGAAEVLACEGTMVTCGFQYALYRERLNDLKQKGLLEEVLSEVTGKKLFVKAVLTAQKNDGSNEFSPGISISKDAKLPEGFSDLIKEFGGTVV